MSTRTVPVWVATDLVHFGDDEETIHAVLAEWLELEERATFFEPMFRYLDQRARQRMASATRITVTLLLAERSGLGLSTSPDAIDVHAMLDEWIELELMAAQAAREESRP